MILQQAETITELVDEGKIMQDFKEPIDKLEQKTYKIWFQ